MSEPSVERNREVGAERVDVWLGEPLARDARLQSRVDLEHRYFDRFGARGSEMRAIFDSGGVPGAPQGWAGILREFAAVVTPEHDS